MKKYLFLLPLLTITLQSRAMDVQDQFLRAVGGGNMPVVRRLLLDSRIDINESSPNIVGQLPALHMAATEGMGNLALTQLLLDAGADVNVRDFFGETALFNVASPEIAKLLLDKGIDVSIKENRTGFTAIDKLESLNRAARARNANNLASRTEAILKTIKEHIQQQAQSRENQTAASTK